MFIRSLVIVPLLVVAPPEGAPPSAPEKAANACPAFMEQLRDGACCYPGLTHEERGCIGTAKCPAGSSFVGGRCVSVTLDPARGAAAKPRIEELVKLEGARRIRSDNGSVNTYQYRVRSPGPCEIVEEFSSTTSGLLQVKYTYLVDAMLPSLRHAAPGTRILDESWCVELHPAGEHWAMQYAKSQVWKTWPFAELCFTDEKTAQRALAIAQDAWRACRGERRRWWR